MFATVRFTLVLTTWIGATICLAEEPAVSILDHDMSTLSGEDVNLAAKYDGKVVLLVNVASKCGYTKQYTPLQELHERYADQGLAIVGVPCNQFGGQEPGTSDEIATFCQVNYGVAFDMLGKVNVNPPEACALYEQLTSESTPAGPIAWNFEKFLIGRDGQIVGRYKSAVEPLGEELTGAIESELTK